MNKIEAALRAIARVLEQENVPFALVGGLAVSARAEPRFTRDVDLAVGVKGDPEAEALVHNLTRRGYVVRATVEQEETHRLATVRLEPSAQSAGGVVVDVLFASSGIEQEIVRAAEPTEIVPLLTLPLATTGHLIALKVLSERPERPQDVADLRALVGVAGQEDFDVARASLRLIAQRGFNRGRNLLERLEKYVPATIERPGPR